METLHRTIREFVICEDGPTAVEYAVMLALIIIVCLAGIRLVGIRTEDMFNTVSTELTLSP